MLHKVNVWKPKMYSRSAKDTQNFHSLEEVSRQIPQKEKDYKDCRLSSWSIFFFRGKLAVKLFLVV